MAFDKDAFLTALDGMSVMELNDLVKAIEEKFGVSAAMMAAPVAMAGAAGGAAAPAAEAQTEFDEGQRLLLAAVERMRDAAAHCYAPQAVQQGVGRAPHVQDHRQIELARES